MKKKTILLTAIAVMLAACASIAGMLAYFTDTTEEVKNVFTAGKASIDLTEDVTETDYITERKDGSGYDYHVFPGQEYQKNPTVTVGADSEDAYLAAVVTVKSMENLKKAFGVGSGAPLYLASMGLISGGIADYDAIRTDTWNGMHGTVLVDANGDDFAFVTYAEDAINDSIVYTYWFFNVAEKNDKFVLFEKFTVPAKFDKEMQYLNDMSIAIKAYAAQAVGFDNAYAALHAAFSDVF